MEVYFTERSEVTRTYTLDIEPEEFIDWLDGQEPSDELLYCYISSNKLDKEPSDEIEYIIESGVDNPEEFLSCCE